MKFFKFCIIIVRILKDFFYLLVYDSGTIFEPEILDITDDDLKAKFLMVRQKELDIYLTLSIYVFYNS